MGAAAVAVVGALLAAALRRYPKAPVPTRIATAETREPIAA
jgi:hypothetical protein